MGEWIVLLDRFRRPLSAIRPGRSGMLPMKGASPSRLASTAAAGGWLCEPPFIPANSPVSFMTKWEIRPNGNHDCRTQARNPCWHGGASGAWGGSGCWSPPRGRELLLAIRQLGFPLQAGGVDLGRDAVRDMRAQPGDCGDLVLDTGRGVGQLGELVMLAFGRQG